MSHHAPLPIAIVGAGLAGLSCAQALLQAGHTVHIFDKSRGPSGRMSTRRGEDARGAWQCDHGAQYFTAQDEDFRAEVARWQEAGVARVWDARLVSFDGTSWQSCATQRDRFVGTPRMTSPANWLAGTLGPGAQTHWQTTVQRLEHCAEGWTIASAEHGRHAQRYAAVVLAVPAPQAASLLSPVSPEGAAVAASVRMLACWALMVRCPAPLSLPWEGAFVNAGPLSWIARDSSKPSRTGLDTWLLHASPEWSEANQDRDATAVAADLLRAFAALGGPDPAHAEATAHRWRYAQTEQPLSTGFWWDAQARIGQCGDWLNAGKVQGAWLSGRALAKGMSGLDPTCQAPVSPV